MGMIFEDGRGRGSKAGVSSDFRMETSTRSNSRSYYISRDDGQVYGVTSHDATAAAGTYILYFKNTSTSKDFYIDYIECGGVETALWKVWFVTGTAAGGSALTPTNLNKKSGNVASATVRGDDSITGLSTDGQIGALRTPANDSHLLAFDDTVVLGTGDAIAIEYDAGTTGIAEVFMRGYYE